ncbi:1,4-alpha-glucan branching protein GlgB [Robertmurraya kyonggiensis]|uniref:1,4-alpha-glucan branching enzyme GlgB n=1 Tax=Robertmurraya kyonggiensis TaxID=1037680 RepID=A0A4U1DCF1_9BACI|nr:1,4-alpha-glucan branching protein GlgB [Robertmurraya kyonggiensis]TKC19307.1 1,4-alpha-glucan branching protein GlgB [Robertmurraya kyonggiensis]
MQQYKEDMSVAKYLFHHGKNFRAYDYLGSHFSEYKEKCGYVFRVWAPNASAVSIVGDFNHWDPQSHPMVKETNEGIWELFVEGLEEFSLYKYAVTTKDGRVLFKADPYAVYSETKEKTASYTYRFADKFTWTDYDWQMVKEKQNIYESPLNIYEVHLGSWRKTADDGYLNYRAIANELIPYVKKMGYTHIELLPLAEHPFDGSWGYQVCGYYSVTSRFGKPEDFMYFVNLAHEHGIGVIMDWVPAHFPKDAHGLYEFDGQPLYEYKDPLKQEHKQWGTRIFDFGRKEVQAFLISNAIFFMEKYHIDGLRVDAVASMIYLNYNRESGEWRPNAYGGEGNLEAIDFIRTLNHTVLTNFPHTLMIAEESTAWPGVTLPPSHNGLGFNYKWNMGWMNDVLSYMEVDPIARQYHHGKLTFPIVYACDENFILPISHDEVVHGKRSLLDKMPGDYHDKFAGVRSFLLYMLSHPGKKLMFMGCEIGQFIEWNYKKELEWFLLKYESHKKLQTFFSHANHFYLQNRPLWELDCSGDGFKWICHSDHTRNILSFRRMDKAQNELVIVVNFSPVLWEDYYVGVPEKGQYKEIFNTDLKKFGGSGIRNRKLLGTTDEPMHELDQYISITLPPLTTLVIQHTEQKSVRI